MPTVTSHRPGSFCWIELATADVDAARAFYIGLFGWSISETPMGEMGTYYIFSKRDLKTAAMYEQASDEQSVPAWLSYVSVARVEETSEKVRRLGGRVLSGPLDVADAGRMSVLMDPQGAAFAVWQPVKHAGVEIRDETGTLCWNELQARDLDGSKKFYTALFGWRARETDDYTEWCLDENAVGGMMRTQTAGKPPHWLPYFAVDDCDATVVAAERRRAAVSIAPIDIPAVGRYAVMTDPQGAAFAVICLAA